MKTLPLDAPTQNLLPFVFHAASIIDLGSLIKLYYGFDPFIMSFSCQIYTLRSVEALKRRPVLKFQSSEHTILS
jgi:hypothetical protein